MCRAWWLATLIAAPLSIRAQTVLGGATTIIVQGRVVRTDSVPIAGVLVTFEASGTGAIRTARTDSEGRYKMPWVGDNRSASLTALSIGHRRQRRTVDRLVATNGILHADFVMPDAMTLLPAQKIVGVRPTPLRDGAGRGTTPGERRTGLDSESGLSGDLSGDVTAALGLIPGVTLTTSADGTLKASVFGLSEDQNGQTLNGANLSVGVLPRDGLLKSVRLATYDPKVGRFGGLQETTTVPSGTFLSLRSLHLTVDDPALQHTTPASLALGSTARELIVSGTASGPFHRERQAFSGAWQLQQRSSDLISLLNGTPLALQAVGVSADSVAVVLATARRLGLPLTTGGAAKKRTTTSGSVVGRLDFTANAQATGDQTKDVLYLLLNGSWKQTRGLNVSPTGLPTKGSTSGHRDAAALLNFAPYLRSALNETQTRVSYSEDETLPVLSLPSASVLLDSRLPDGTDGSIPASARRKRRYAQCSAVAHLGNQY